MRCKFELSGFFLTDLAYNIALCYYSLKQYAAALKYIAEIIERGIREHPGGSLKVFGCCVVFYCLGNINAMPFLFL